jgi:hypothetical protein
VKVCKTSDAAVQLMQAYQQRHSCVRVRAPRQSFHLFVLGCAVRLCGKIWRTKVISAVGVGSNAAHGLRESPTVPGRVLRGTSDAPTGYLSSDCAASYHFLRFVLLSDIDRESVCV